MGFAAELNRRFNKSQKWDQLYLDIASRVGQMSHCDRAKVGALIVRDNNILAFGYNGTPAGADNCCEIDGKTKKEVLHAETNAITKIARSTNTSEGATLYTTLSPCMECAKLIIQAGIKEVIYHEKYYDESSITFLEDNNVKVKQV
mgnify:CR=1 FL=1